MTTLFEYVGLQNVLLVTIPPVLGFLGSLVRVLGIRNSLEDVPTKAADVRLFSGGVFYARFNWYIAWGLTGLASGLLIGLLFVGALADNFPSLARVCALALVSGYGAPALWKQQEKLVSSLVEARVKNLLPTNGTVAKTS